VTRSFIARFLIHDLQFTPSLYLRQLTTDIALATDPEYRKYVEEFANDQSAFDDAFAKVWYKLVNRDRRQRHESGVHFED